MHFRLCAMPIRLVRAVMTAAIAKEFVGAPANLVMKLRRRGLSRVQLRS